MTRVRPTLVRVAHAVALAAAIATLALSLRESALLLPLLLVALAALGSPFMEWTGVPPALARALPGLQGLGLVAVVIVAGLSRAMGVLFLDPALLPQLAAPVLVPIAILFLLAPGTFPTARTLARAVISLLAVAGLNPAPAGYAGSRLPFLTGMDRNGFAEVYLAAAIFTSGALWIGAFGAEGPRWSRQMLGAVAATVVVGVALAATGVMGLPLAQPLVEKALAGALNQGTTGLSHESTLGDIGSLAQSRRRVLDLQSSLPSGGRWLLVSEVLTRFDGRRWTNDPSAQSRAGVLRPLDAPAETRLLSNLGRWFPGPAAGEGDSVRGLPPASGELRITQAELDDWPLLLPRHVAAVTANTPHLDVDRFGLVRRPLGLALRQYGALLAAGGESSPENRGDLTPEERAVVLSPPPSVDSRVADLARRLAAPSATPRERLVATLRHLQTGYRYTLSPGPFRPDGDPLAEFLFEKKAAYCEYFASAAVVLLRLQGVPARFVKGLSVGSHTDAGGGLHVVRESDAHAWIEAWIPGEGWVTADPTPPGQFESARGAPSRFRRWIEHARAAVAGAWARVIEGGPLAFLRWLGREALSLAARGVREPVVWLVAAALVFGRGVWRRLYGLLRRRRDDRRRDDTAHVSADLRVLVRDLERRWSSHGRPRLPSRGLLEHASALAGPPPAGAAELPAPLVEAGAEIVRAYYMARFGEGETPSPEQLRRLRAGLGG